MEIPTNIKKEISLIEKGKRLKKRRVEQKIPYSQLLSLAKNNLTFLDRIANAEPILSFLRKNSRRILIVNWFNSTYPQHNSRDNLGRLILTVINEKASLYDWIDADYPANRSNRDYTLVTEKELEKWHPKSLERFALLTEKAVWKNIFQKLRIMRSY